MRLLFKNGAVPEVHRWHIDGCDDVRCGIVCMLTHDAFTLDLNYLDLNYFMYSTSL